MAEDIIVLKFGSSVIPSESALTRIVDEIRRWIIAEYRVVAVVSAIGGATDSLLAHALRYGEASGDGDGHALAAYVATGELQAAALLGLALGRAGIDAAVLDAATIGLGTKGPALDARPVRLDEGRALRALARHRAIVVPGFIGRDEEGRTTLLGRGGSDLSALFIAHHLGARCRLVKDVDGLYDRDPAAAGGVPARRFEFADYETVLGLDEGIIQHKAVRFAREHDQEFEVGALGADGCTRIGATAAVSV